jgi:2-C-methyl-D-erythritol 4-phosphate cytidylyltransferase
VRDTVVLVPAAGAGTRLGRRTPKQFLRLGGQPMLAVTVRRILRYPRVRAVVVAAPRNRLVQVRRLLAGLRPRVPVTVVAGGASRQESVYRALRAAPEAPVVVVHDAVRPFVSQTVLEAVVRAARTAGAAVCGLPVTDTIKRVRAGWVEDTLDRSALWAVQTPQAFRTPLLREAHHEARRHGVVATDDAALVERLGHRVRVVLGSPENLKITTLSDLRRARGRS